ncbi:S-adenosyl-L-methionine-dependent methyltransferase [Tribonema minus]|uniref:mRNA (guanine-N(7))-methyltransferase n=1 Tax=Tribonema minus TaxID=303371 RepID=A0A836CLM7_9STRA|nr:S-adenosyl-L-methionine-dependent methyltransferase [Tribonema minus]
MAPLRHKLLTAVGQPAKKLAFLCDVISTDARQCVPDGIAGELVVVRYSTSLQRIHGTMRAFPLVPHHSADESTVRGFLEYLKRKEVAAVVPLNKHGWNGYILPDEDMHRMLCYFENVQHADSHWCFQTCHQLKTCQLTMLHDAFVCFILQCTLEAAVPPAPPPPAPSEPVFSIDQPEPPALPLGALGPVDLFAPQQPVDPFAPPADPFAPQVASHLLAPQADMFAPQLGQAGLFAPQLGAAADGGEAALKGVSNGVVTGGLEQSLAASHYNSLVRKRDAQAQSYIYHLRRFNNWVKMLLIRRAEPERGGGKSVRVLELACGKGGDLPKWSAGEHKPKHYVGMDIAKQSLVDMVARLEDDTYLKLITHEARPPLCALCCAESKHLWTKQATIRLVAADLGSGDMYSDPTLDVWTRGAGWEKGVAMAPAEKFDVVSMQFALHYMAQSEAMLRRFLFFVSRHLRVGGQFLATTTDARVLLELLMGHSEPSEDGKHLVVDMIDSWDHNLLTIKFDRDARDTLLRRDATAPDTTSPLGVMYHYILREEAQGQEAVDAPEWMIPLGALRRLAGEAGLEVKSALNLHHFYTETVEQGDSVALNALSSMNVTNHNSTMDPSEWALARLYMTLVLVKTHDPDPELEDPAVLEAIAQAKGKSPADEVRC